MKKKIIIGAIVSSILGLGILGVNSVKQESVKVATWHHPLLDHKI